MFDFGLGASELLFIAIVTLIVVGPKDLPRLLRTIGQYARKIRGLAREFQTHLDEASKEAGLDDVKKEVKGMTNFTVTSDLDKQGKDIKRAMEDSAPKSSAGSEAKTPDGKSTTAVEDAIAKSEADKPDKAAATANDGADKPKAETAKADKPKAGTAKADAAKPGTAKTNNAKTTNAKADTSRPETGKAAKPKPAAKSKPAAKAKPQAGRSHETVKS